MQLLSRSVVSHSVVSCSVISCSVIRHSVVAPRIFVAQKRISSSDVYQMFIKFFDETKNEYTFLETSASIEKITELEFIHSK